MTVLPAPSPQYDARNEAETRRSIEQALARLSSNVPDVGGAALGGSGTTGKVPLWTGPTTLGDSDIDVANIAYLSDLFTQADADARYSLLGHTHTASEITDFNTAGDTRWWKLGETTLPGPLDIGDVTGMAPALLRVGGKIGASDEVDALDFVLVGGSGGGGPASALFSVSDEGALIASAVASINFVGGGVQASAVGDAITVSITFDQAAADARYALLGHTHSVAAITDFDTAGDARWAQFAGAVTITGAWEFTNSPTLANGVSLYGRRGSDNVAVSMLRYDDGTSDISMILGGPIMRWRDTGSGVPMSLTAAGVLTVAEEVDSGDFVLVGGSGGGGASAALFSVLDEGVLKANNVSSINFVGAGVVASAVGDAVTVTISFDQAAADARYVQIANFNTLGDSRYSLLGHTHTFASLTSKPTTIGGYGITDFNSLGDARWFLKGPNVNLSGNVNPYVGFFDGTYQTYLEQVGGAFRIYHNGAERVRFPIAGGSQFTGAITADNAITLSGASAAYFVNDRVTPTHQFAFYATGDKGILWSGQGIDALTINYSDGVVTTARGLIAKGAGYAWTSAGWQRAISVENGVAISFGYGAAIDRWGIGNSGGTLYFFRALDDGTGTAPAYYLTLNSSGFAINAAMTFNESPSVANGKGYFAARADGVPIRVMGYDAGTSDLSTVMGGSIWRVRDTGSGVLMSLNSSGDMSCHDFILS